MRRFGQTLMILVTSTLALTSVHAASNKPTLDAWVDDSLIPSVVSQLKTHPRFNNEIVRFVVMQDGKQGAKLCSLPG